MQETRMLTYKPRWFQNQKLILGTMITIVIWWALTAFFNLSGIIALVLAVQLVLFFSLFYRPVWAMAALIVGQLTATSYMVTLGSTQISVRLLWAVLALLLVIPVLKARGGIKLGSHPGRVLIPMIIFFGLATAANVVNVDMPYVWQYVRTGITSLAIVFFLPAVVNTEKDLKILSIVTLITCLVSAIIAILQHYSFLGMPVISLYPDSILRGRTVGLTEGPVHLAYDLSVIMLPMIALFFLKGVSSRMRRLLPVLTLIIFVALFFSYTRSGLYSLAPAILGMALLISGKMRKEFIIITLVLIVGFFAYIQFSGSRYSKGFGEESSATGRLALWQAGAKIAMDYPVFGIGQGRFEQVSKGYASEVYVESMPEVVDVLGTEQPHNDFIRVWLSFGTPALLAFLAIFFGIFRNFYRGYRDSTKLFVKGLSLGCFAALIAYIVNAATHNLMDTVPLLWILAGLSIAVVKLSGKSKPKVESKIEPAS